MIGIAEMLMVLVMGIFVGVAIALAFAQFGYPVAGLIAATTVGAVKEWFYNSAHQDKHTVDRLDFLATVAGGILGFAVACVAEGVK